MTECIDYEYWDSRPTKDDQVKTLRSLCEKFGDNEWSDDEDLSEVLINHLWKHL